VPFTYRRRKNETNLSTLGETKSSPATLKKPSKVTPIIKATPPEASTPQLPPQPKRPLLPRGPCVPAVLGLNISNLFPVTCGRLSSTESSNSVDKLIDLKDQGVDNRAFECNSTIPTISTSKVPENSY